MVSRLYILLHRHARRATALLAALAVVAGACGIPIYQPAAKDADGAYPCMHHACGCASADACWKKCCCYTRDQKLAWAKEHGVRPPEFVVRLAANESSRPPSAASCCKTKGKTSGDEPADAPSWQVVRLEDARQCQGLTSLWLVLSQALLPSEPQTFSRELPLSGWLAAPASAQLSSPAFDPATPPPRRSA